ncbi:MAG: FeoA domain [Acidobacteriota bacterium]|jgi:Fe2+ transport system protein FeoA|nr:FeoA domain [Acidobacteriota bacterium]
MNQERSYDCPLCGTDFAHAECRSSCPMSRGCTMVRCPHCGYEFVESGRFVDMLRRWIRRAPAIPAPSATMRITEMPVGSVAEVAYITPTSASRLSRLASFGIVAGSEVRLIARRPAVVVGCGSSSVALEDEVGREIFVSAPAAR